MSTNSKFIESSSLSEVLELITELEEHVPVAFGVLSESGWTKIATKSFSKGFGLTQDQFRNHEFLSDVIDSDKQAVTSWLEENPGTEPKSMNVQIKVAEGIEISIDDFGKGETNLNTLSHLTIDYIKLDKGLLRLKTPKATRAMLKIGTEMAKMLDAVIVCEGIETEEDLEMCKELGIKLGQGWLLGMPEPLLIQESNS